MDPIDGDARMLDAPEALAKQSKDLSAVPSKPLNGSALPSAPLASPRQSRLHRPSRPNSPLSENGALNPGVKRLRERSREPSVLASSINKNLSIRSPSNGHEGTPSSLASENDVEHEPPTPYSSSLPTGLCYDVRMRYHCELDPPKQRLDFHPEDPRRIFKIYKELCMAGLVKDNLLNTGTLIPNPLVRIAAREILEEEVCLVHDKRHYDMMQKTMSISPCQNTSDPIR